MQPKERKFLLYIRLISKLCYCGMIDMSKIQTGTIVSEKTENT